MERGSSSVQAERFSGVHFRRPEPFCRGRFELLASALRKKSASNEPEKQRLYPGKQQFVRQALGLRKAVAYAKQLIHYVFKQEILNEKIHLLAEGTGALIADELLRSIPNQIRSAAMVNPCLDLQAHHKREKENKFFYKQFIKEIAESYGITERKAADYPFKSISPYHNLVPVHIWQRLNGSPYPYMIHAKR